MSQGRAQSEKDYQVKSFLLQGVSLREGERSTGAMVSGERRKAPKAATERQRQAPHEEKPTNLTIQKNQKGANWLWNPQFQLSMESSCCSSKSATVDLEAVSKLTKNQLHTLELHRLSPPK